MESTKEESKPTRVDELYSMYKTMKISQQLNYEKTEEDREKSEMSQCTFKPKTTPLNREIFFKARNDSYNESNDFYIKRMKKIREDKVNKDRRKKELSDKRLRITVPKEFRITSDKKNSNKVKKELLNINYLCRYNIEKGIKIDKKMNYSDAIKFLHNELLNTNTNIDNTDTDTVIDININEENKSDMS